MLSLAKACAWPRIPMLSQRRESMAPGSRTLADKPPVAPGAEVTRRAAARHLPTLRYRTSTLPGAVLISTRRAARSRPVNRLASPGV